MEFAKRGVILFTYNCGKCLQLRTLIWNKTSTVVMKVKEIIGFTVQLFAYSTSVSVTFLSTFSIKLNFRDGFSKLVPVPT